MFGCNTVGNLLMEFYVSVMVAIVSSSIEVPGPAQG